MAIGDLLTPERVRANAEAKSKKRALELVSELLVCSTPSLGQNEVFTSLLNRERLGSTGLGRGVALPHGRVPNLNTAIGAFMRLPEAVSFDAIDDQPVDLIFAMIVPEESTEGHLEMLSQLAQLFSNEEICQRLRDASSREEILHTIKSLKLDMATP